MKSTLLVLARVIEPQIKSFTREMAAIMDVERLDLGFNPAGILLRQVSIDLIQASLARGVDLVVPGQPGRILFRFVCDNFSSSDLGCVWKQGGQILSHVIRSRPV